MAKKNKPDQITSPIVVNQDNPPKKQYKLRPKKKYDDEAIARVYRTGQYSDREIARKFGCSHTYVWTLAREKGLKKDLHARVAKEIENKLLYKIATGNSDEEIIDAAATVGAAVIELHRKDIQKLRKEEQKLLMELSGKPTKLYLANYKGEVIQKTVGIAVTEKSSSLLALAQTMTKRIALEREAFGLNKDDGKGDGKTEEINITYVQAEQHNQYYEAEG